MSKECALCHMILDDNCFTKNARNKDGLHSYCKKCNALKAKIYNQTKGKTKMYIHINRQIEKGYFRFGHGAFVNMMKSAKHRNICFNITETELRDWWINTKDICEYCNESINEYITEKEFIVNNKDYNEIICYLPSHVYNKSNYIKIKSMTIDRKNSEQGYEIKNLVKSCWICNSIKSNKYSYEEMKIIGIKLKKYIKETMEG